MDQATTRIRSGRSARSWPGRVRASLPRGQTLPAEEFERRHRWLLWFLWLQLPALVLYGTLRGFGPLHLVLEALPIAVFGWLGALRWPNRRLRASYVALGLLSCAAVAVHTAGGIIEADFYFFVVVVLLTLYEDWLPFLLAIGYVILNHGLLGTIDRSAVYSHGGSPWFWALIHGAFIAAAGTAAVLAWRLNEDVRDESDRVNKALRESDQRFAGAFDHASHGMALVAPEGRFLQVNESLCRIVGYPRAELLKKTFQDITHPDDLDADLEHVGELLEGEIETYELEKRYFHADGHVVWVLLSVSLVRDSSGAPVHFVSQVQDITQRRRIEGELRASEQRFRALTATAPVGIAASDGDGGCVYVNEEWSRLTGLTPSQARGRGWVNALHEDDRNRVYREWVEATEEGREFSTDHRYRRPDGRVVWVSSRAIAMDHAEGRATGYIGTVVDITELKLAKQRMEELALRDDLTGLANRRRFHEELETHIARARRYGWGGALLSLDLDRLKAVNDTLGHPAGDQLIRQAATRLRARLRGSDFLARLGGDEFAVLIPRADADSARTVAADLVDAMASHDVSIGGASTATTSVGVALIAEPVTVEELMIRADIALYEAKAAGGNRFAFYSIEADERYLPVTP